MRADEDLVPVLERVRVNAGVGLNREHDAVDGSEDLVHLSDLGLVVQVGAGVEVRDHVVGELVHHLVLARVHELAKLWFRRSLSET